MTDFRVTLDDIEIADAVEKMKVKDAATMLRQVLEQHFAAVDVEEE